MSFHVSDFRGSYFLFKNKSNLFLRNFFQRASSKSISKSSPETIRNFDLIGSIMDKNLKVQAIRSFLITTFSKLALIKPTCRASTKVVNELNQRDPSGVQFYFIVNFPIGQETCKRFM